MMYNKILKYLLCFSLVSLLIIGFSDGIIAAEFDMKSYDYDDQLNLYIDVGGAEITFDQDSSQIRVSNKLKVKLNDNSIHIRSPKRTGFFNFFNDEDFRIIIGTKYRFNKVDIDVGGAQIDGLIEADKIYIDGGGVSISADMFSERVSIDGGGVKVTSMIEAQNISIDGAGMDIYLELKDTEDLDLDGAGITANVRYLDTWTGQRYLKMNGVGGNLDVYVPSDDSDEIMGELNVDANGMIDVDINHY